jgi:uncharacterized membrane protein
MVKDVIVPPMEKRRAEWMNDIAERLKALEDASVIDHSFRMPASPFLTIWGRAFL